MGMHADAHSCATVSPCAITVALPYYSNLCSVQEEDPIIAKIMKAHSHSITLPSS